MTGRGRGDLALAVLALFVASAVGVTVVEAQTVSIQGMLVLPLSLAICATNRATGACLGAPSNSVTTQINPGATPTFGVFVTGQGLVPFDPAANRIFVRFRDGGGTVRGATSVALRTE